MRFTDIENEEELYMVHKTDFFPRDHIIRSTYDGERVYTKNRHGEEIVVNLGEESKSVFVPSHRHTTHFTLNSVVEPAKDGAGNWDDKPMAIIEPFAPHKDQFTSFGDGDSVAWGSVNLSDNAVIIIRRDSLGLIPETEQGKWNIIVSDEPNIAKSVNDYFRERNIPIIEYEDHAGHSFSTEYRMENNLQARDMAINFLRDNTYDGKSPITLSIDEVDQVLNIQHDKNNRPATIKPITGVMIVPREDGMASRDFCDLIIANGFCIDENGNYMLKDDEEIFRNMTSLKENIGEVDDKSFEEIETIYSNYMDYISTKSPDELTDYEAEMIRLEREKVRAIRDRQPEELSRYQQIAIARDDARLLRFRKGELDQSDTQRVESLKPQQSINFEDQGFSIKYNIIEDVSEEHAKQFGLKDEVHFSIEPDEETQKEFWDNPDSINFRNKCEIIAERTKGVESITPFIDPYDGFPSQFNISMPIQREDETYGEFYSRIQSYIEGIKSTMAGKEVEFGERGANVQENFVVQQHNETESKTTIQGYEESQLGQGMHYAEMQQQESTEQQQTGLSFQDIGKETVESFKRNPQEAIKMMQTLERGIAEREDKGNEKQ